MANVTILGTISADAKNETVGNSTITKFQLPENTKNKDGIQETTWYQVEIWGKENLAEYLKKGTSVMVTGKLKPKAYLAKDGQAKMELRIVSFDLSFVPGSKKAEETAA